MDKAKSNSRTKKSAPKTNTAQPPEKENKVAENQNNATPDEENPFDFGGLPRRDLKKNLGCG